MRGMRRTRSLFEKSSAKTFLKSFAIAKFGSLNKVLSVYNKTAYFNEKNRRTAFATDGFYGIWGLIAEMKKGCHGSTVKKKC